MTTAHPSIGETRNLWILGAKPDLLLIVLTPLLIVPIFMGLQTSVDVAEIAVYVAAFGAFGHQLPGILRAYGDPQLFERFKVRFTVAPILLVVGCMIGVYYNLVVLTLLVVLWGFWHAVMQVFGFVRIYDAKVGSDSQLTERLDLAVLFSWFLLGLFGSGGHMAGILSKVYVMGGPLVRSEDLDVARSVLFWVACAATSAFLVNMIRERRLGRPPSPIKLMLIVSSAGMYWYAMVFTGSAILGIALFEVFHDVQYLTIVWAFNNRLSEKRGNDAGVFTQFLFRKARVLIALYVVLVAAYGMIGFILPKLIASGTVWRALSGVLVAAGLLHFYFDGFIWKVRERETRAGLDLAGGSSERVSAIGVDRGWAPHALKWGLLLVPFLLYATMQIATPPTLDRHRVAALAHPYAAPHHKVGRQLLANGMPNEAVQHFREAISLDPKFAAAHHELGMWLMGRRPAEGVEHLGRVVELEPTMKKPRIVYGDALLRLGRFEEAADQYRRAIELGDERGASKLDAALALLEERARAPD